MSTKTTIHTMCAALVALTFAVAPAEAKKKGGPHGSGHGVVLAHTDADTFVYANGGGELRAVDTTTLPAVGSVVKVKAKRGVAQRIRVTGTATKARVQGLVTASAADSFTVTGKKDDDAAVSVAYAAPITAPSVGQRVKVNVTIAGTTLTATKVKLKGRGALEVKGQLTAIDPTARTLTVAPAGGGTPIVVAVPVSKDLTTFAVGQTVKLKVLLLADGTYVLQSAKGHDDHGDDDDDDEKSDKRKGRGPKNS
ncbi:MAG: hypothetical protein JHC84_14190 [Solirubrobacteraceae bacterium]|nr:hypothetical protein [Solirubrobacteraceae bacterium]